VEPVPHYEAVAAPLRAATWPHRVRALLPLGAPPPQPPCALFPCRPCDARLLLRRVSDWRLSIAALFLRLPDAALQLRLLPEPLARLLVLLALRPGEPLLLLQRAYARPLPHCVVLKLPPATVLPAQFATEPRLPTV